MGNITGYTGCESKVLSATGQRVEVQGNAIDNVEEYEYNQTDRRVRMSWAVTGNGNYTKKLLSQSTKREVFNTGMKWTLESLNLSDILKIFFGEKIKMAKTIHGYHVHFLSYSLFTIERMRKKQKHLLQALFFVDII